MDFSRRNFIRLAGVVGVSGAIGLTPLAVLQAGARVSLPAVLKTDDAPRYGMFIDLEKCVGCNACTVACIRENNTPRGIGYINVLAKEEPRAAYLDTHFQPMQCMHCEDPACVPVCPVQATYKRADGIVVQDLKRCIGCKYCMQACPYQVRHFNKKPPFTYSRPHPAGGSYPGGVVLKCTFCQHRIDAGNITTACTEACPADARYFGDLNDPRSDVSRVIFERKGIQLLPEKLTRPQIFYGLPKTERRV
ncbi:prokaryotic molybdopterin-containing oxidoreductase family, iron-sulfur binding subunit/tetrathionate reductase subunit B [Desulfonatronum zhilinae]|nr:prokaryotic molybdopterin-containing oxidoreductase family, iron-sulfur binding subunit/tetrathionate reductase subunit B [Desulfonatronum zhilinae]